MEDLINFAASDVVVLALLVKAALVVWFS